MSRYEKYRDSGIAWIGEIPDGWELTKAKNIFKQRSTKGSSTNVLLSATQKYGMCPQYLIEGVVQVKQDTDFNTFKTVLINDFVISLRSFQGGFEMSDYEGVCSPAYQVFHNKVNIFHKFWKYLFKSYGFISQINAFTMGIREGKNIQYFDFSLMQLSTPNTIEQEAIAEFLDRKCGEVDELIKLQEQMIIELGRYKQSVITETVTRGLNPDAPLRDSGIEWIGEIPEHWTKDKIIRSFSLIGSGTTPKATNENNYQGSINWLQSGDIKGEYIEESKNKISNEAFELHSVLKIYNHPFIVIAMYGASVGNLAISSIDACVNQACCVLGESKQIFKFLFYAIKASQQFLIYRAEGGGQPNISQDKLKNLWITIPPLSEQQAIANYLDQKCKEIDELTEIKRQKIEQLKEYKKSIIYEYVTGKKRVNIQ